MAGLRLTTSVLLGAVLFAGAEGLVANQMPSAAAQQARAATVTAAPPSPADVLGYDLGERFTDHAGVVRYLETLASASPRVQVRRYGTTVEGRPLVQVVIAREDHWARLDEILERNRELADPDTPEARAREIAASNPAVVYFSYGVHGNESSSSEAALWTAWDLARDADAVAGVLDSVVVVIDPAVNPDGRDRYVQWYRQVRNQEPNLDPDAREHWEPWPGGRYNHYLFDLNRDWAWMSQPETRARLATWDHWTPQVHVDFHEMSWRSSYFFFPPAEPINPMYPDHVLDWARRIGEGNAAAFDAEGWLYFTGESYDLFYPGYGDSWPSLLGAIGMTYEQAGGGRAGLAIERPDGTVLTLRDRAQHHRTTGEATLRTVAAGKSDLLLGFARVHRTVDEGLPDVLLVPGEDPTRVEALVELLRRQGIRVERADRSFRADARPHKGFERRRRFPAGTYRVPARQPRGRLAITLLQSETVLNATYSYDISAWSLPYAYGVEAHAAEEVPDGARWDALPTYEPAARERVTRASTGEGMRRAAPGLGGSRAEERPVDEAAYGVLVAPGFDAWPALVRYMQAGGRVVLLDEAVTTAGREWPAGTLFLPRRGVDDFARKIAESGLADRGTVVRSGLTTGGPDLGTEEAYALDLPRVAIVSGEGISATSYGAHWFFLERTLELPFTAIPTDRLADVELGDYDVLVVPDAYGSALDEEALEHVRGWVRRGGTVVAVAGGARTVAEELADIQIRSGENGDATLGDLLRGRKARELERWEERIPGTILQIRLDPAHPLAFGAGVDGDPGRLFVLYRGGLAFEPAEGLETVGHFPAELEKVSGVISQANLDRLSQATWLATRRVGQGRVILFANDPVFRHFWYSTFQPYVNALLVGPKL